MLDRVMRREIRPRHGRGAGAGGGCRCMFDGLDAVVVLVAFATSSTGPARPPCSCGSGRSASLFQSPPDTRVNVWRLGRPGPAASCGTLPPHRPPAGCGRLISSPKLTTAICPGPRTEFDGSAPPASPWPRRGRRCSSAAYRPPPRCRSCRPARTGLGIRGARRRNSGPAPARTCSRRSPSRSASRP